MDYWFTADYHLGHANIIKYCNRPFESLEKMNEAIIRNHNARVKKEDVVFHIGDFCFKNSGGGKEGEQFGAEHYESKLNGKLIQIRGNHDYNNNTKSIIDGVSIHHGGLGIWLTHDPRNYERRFKLNLVGHVHQKWKLRKAEGAILLNIGVDVWRFMPVGINEILEEYEKAAKNIGSITGYMAEKNEVEDG